MAILRAELTGRGTVSHHKNGYGALASVTGGIYDILAEAPTDLEEEASAAYAPGSMAYCLQTDSLYVKLSDGRWTEVSQ